MALPLILDPRRNDYENGTYYPSGDGKPMGETGLHVEAMIMLKLSLDEWLQERHPDSYVAVDMF